MFENVITRAVDRMQVKIDGLDADALARVEESATLDGGDWLDLGDMASRAMLDGIVDQNSAQTLHAIHTDFNDGATLAQRVVFLQAASEILATRISVARR